MFTANSGHTEGSLQGSQESRESSVARIAGQEGSVARILLHLARSDGEKFRNFFLRIRQAYPEQVTRACLRYLTEAESDPVSRQMSAWLARDSAYLNLLFDPDFLPVEEARRSLKIMRESDDCFLRKLSHALDETGETAFLIRALGLLDEGADYSAFCLRLCTLTWHPDPRIRSKAVLALCRIRPNPPVVARHMESKDARVRANAVEALWHSGSGPAVRLFREALSDSHHRVAVNGMLGLYYSNDEGYYGKALELTKRTEANFRVSLAWALGKMNDRRALEVLGKLAEDESAEVRAKALQSAEALLRAQDIREASAA